MEEKASGAIDTWLKDQHCLKKIQDMIRMADDLIPCWPALSRYSLGERIYHLLYDMEELCVAARLKYYKKTTLQDLDIRNHQLQLAIRRARERTYTDRKGNSRHLLQPGGYEKWASLSVETGKLIGAWMQTTKNENNQANT